MVLFCDYRSFFKSQSDQSRPTTLRASICLSNSTEQDIVKGLAVPCQKRVWTVWFRSLLFASQGTKGLVKNHEGTRNLSGRSIKLT